ncbi:MAG: methyltransferase domain-containing protein, partial [Gemmatimonadetes bacterium]|nr:methyltransferase domain-containing protein [Gemmatimonadota bacterium]
MDSSRCPRYRGRIIHIGCGDQRLDGFVNLDARQTSATDLVHSCDDLSFLPTHSFATIYSHAFFEHLFIFQREPCLRSAHRALKEDGTLVFLGLPDFRAIARAYLDGEPGVTLPRFDLREVYRYTHGQPEHAPDWWLEQLHKSLFDQETVTALLKAAGFNDFC